MTNLVVILNNKKIDCTAVFESIGNPKSGYADTDAQLLKNLLTDLADGFIPKMNPNMEYRVNLNGNYYRLLKVFVREADPSIITQDLLVDFLTHAKETAQTVEHPHIIYLVQSFLDKDLTYNAYISPILAEQERLEFVRNINSIAEKAFNFDTRKPMQLSFKIFKIINNHFYLSSDSIFTDNEKALVKDKKVFEIKEMLADAGIGDVECPRSERFVWENDLYYVVKGNNKIDYNYTKLIFIGFKKLTHYVCTNKTNVYKISLVNDTYDERLAIHATDRDGNGGRTEHFSRKVMHRVVKNLQHKKCDEIAEWAINVLSLDKIDDV